MSLKCNCQGKTLFLTIPNAFTYIISKSAARAKPFGTRIIAEISRILFQEYLYGDHLSLVITNKSYWSSFLGLILGLLTLEKSFFSSLLTASKIQVASSSGCWFILTQHSHQFWAGEGAGVFHARVLSCSCKMYFSWCCWNISHFTVVPRENAVCTEEQTGDPASHFIRQNGGAF